MQSQCRFLAWHTASIRLTCPIAQLSSAWPLIADAEYCRACSCGCRVVRQLVHRDGRLAAGCHATTNGSSSSPRFCGRSALNRSSAPCMVARCRRCSWRTSRNSGPAKVFNNVFFLWSALFGHSWPMANHATNKPNGRPRMALDELLAAPWSEDSPFDLESVQRSSM